MALAFDASPDGPRWHVVAAPAAAAAAARGPGAVRAMAAAKGPHGAQLGAAPVQGGPAEVPARTSHATRPANTGLAQELKFLPKE